MILLKCTKCNEELSIDDAFAGGVCRCQHCGTIQTVPKKMKGSGGTVEAPKAVFEKKGAGGLPKMERADIGVSSGLDELAQVVASSGLGSSGLSSGGKSRKRTATVPLPTAKKVTAPVSAAPVKNRMPLVMVAIGILILLALGIVIGLMLKGQGGGQPTPSKGTAEFLGVTLDEPTIVFVLDRGNASGGTLDAVKATCLRVIEHFGADQKVQVIFWQREGDPDVVAVPSSPAAAGEKTRQDIRRVMDEVTAKGSSVAGPALKRAFSSQPDVVVIVTPKHVGDEFTREVMAARGSSGAKVHCFSVDEPAAIAAMQSVASQTGGTAKLVGADRLQTGNR